MTIYTGSRGWFVDEDTKLERVQVKIRKKKYSGAYNDDANYSTLSQQALLNINHSRRS